jgi:hypothetical protein
MSSIQTTVADPRVDASDGFGRIEKTVHRVRCEFDEMPGLCVTPAQAQRLWGLELHECLGVLSALVTANYLRVTARGYTRV